MKPDGCPHSDCARCNGTVAELEKENQRLQMNLDAYKQAEELWCRQDEKREAENARLRERHDMLLRHSRPCDVSESMRIDLGDIPKGVSILDRLNELIDAALGAKHDLG